MIFLWLALALLSLLAVGVLLLPLLRPRTSEPSTADHELAVYRDQLAEVERELQRGILSADQAASARLEIERRMLRAAAAAKTGPTGDGSRAAGKALAMMTALCVPAGALLVYLTLGAPGLPDAPLAARGPEPRGTADLVEFTRLTDRLAARLQQSPEDVRGWTMLGRSYRMLGRTGDSVAAFRSGVTAAGGVERAPAELLADLGEALVIAADGSFTAETHELFARAARDPAQIKARHYLAAERAQAGDLRGALALWRGIEADSPPGAPWLEPLREQIRRVAAELGVDPATVEPAKDAGGPVVATAPPREAVEAAARMSPEERDSFIRGMVARLADRLAARPDDAEGWIRLGRAYGVLGERDQARDAFDKAAALLRRDLDALPPGSPQRAGIEERLRDLERQS